MGLDAKVYCDCFEKGRLNVPERFAGRVQLNWTGCVELSSGDVDEIVEFDDWRNTACQHDEGILVHEWLGNTAGVATLRSLLEQLPSPPDFILERVIYNGTHCGDSINVSELDILSREVEQISQTRDPSVKHFYLQMKGLVEASQSVAKPIVF